MKVIYSTEATAKGGRAGRVRSADGVLDLPLAMPKALGGTGEQQATNPEQLFAAGYAACFESAIRGIAKKQNKQIEDASVTATVGIGPRDQGGFGLAVALKVFVLGLPRDEAQQIVDLAHNVFCPYSNALRGNVDIDVTLC